MSPQWLTYVEQERVVVSIVSYKVNYGQFHLESKRLVGNLKWKQQLYKLCNWNKLSSSKRQL